MEELVAIKTMELDKICRVCLSVKKDMRPLFGEMISEMLMECARIQVDQTDGWPDKICIQCVHQVSRCHAFKSRVEKSDQHLREYIKGITVVIEEPIAQIELQSHPQMQRNEMQTHQITRAEPQHRAQQHQRQEIHIAPAEIQNEISHHTTTATTTHHPTQTQTHTQHHAAPQQMIITNGQLHNAQIINAAGQIVTTSPHQSLITGTQLQTGQILVQTGNGNIQMIQQNGQPQLVQFQRTTDDRCEIIVQQADLQADGTTQYYTEDDEIFSVTTQAIQQEEIEHEEEVVQQGTIEAGTVCISADGTTTTVGAIEEHEEEVEEEVEQELEQEEGVYTLELCEESNVDEDKQYMAEFISLQTSCPYPGLFVCNLCRKEFKHSKWLQTHMKQHSNWLKANCKKQPQCEICHRSFKGPGMLKMHMKTHEKTPEKTPTCKVCNKEFKSRTILYRHRQTHLEKFIQCGVCQKSFSTISQLQSHQAKLNHEKIFKCSQCLVSYTNPNDLKAHIQTHQNNKLEKKG